MTTDHDRRIARNTLLLYLRMILTMGVSIYSSRVILLVLGVADYGIYNVVGGLVVMLSFLNAAMSGTTQRFLNYEMGKGADGSMADIFTAAWKIHVWLSAIILLLGETLGLWLVNHYLVIAPERMGAANAVYQLSLLGSIFTVLSVPFSGAVFAHEKMGFFAVVQLSGSISKLFVALLLLWVRAIDHLVVFMAFITLIQGGMLAAFAWYGRRNFGECSFKFKVDKVHVHKLLRYSLYDLSGTTLYTVGVQGSLVVINRVGGTILNAAAGVATTVSNALNQFGQTVIMAFRPQIIAQYSGGNYERMSTLIINCTRYSLLLYAVFALPVFMEMDYVLALWLKLVPAHSVAFCKLVLISSAASLCIQTLNAGMHATGDIKKFSLVTGLTYVANLPIMYYLMLWTDNPNWAYIVPICQLSTVIVIVETMLHNRVSQFSTVKYMVKGIIGPVVIICTVGLALHFGMTFIEASFWRLCAVAIMGSLLLAGGSWAFIFTPDMRVEVAAKIKEKLHL